MATRGGKKEGEYCMMENEMVGVQAVFGGLREGGRC
jgi:hypothetical protein